MSSIHYHILLLALCFTHLHSARSLLCPHANIVCIELKERCFMTVINMLLGLNSIPRLVQ
ncbi:hypothetical protein LINPERPRIM_LOCUS18723 [Linum perenne]